MPHTIDRRELLKIASSAFTALTLVKTNWAMPDELVQNVAKAPNWKPAFFNSHQNETLTILTELIIPRTDTPGANDAMVHRYIDLFMSAGNIADGQRQQLVDGLAWLDEYSKQLYKRTFVESREEDRVSILNQIASADNKEPTHPGHAFFKQAKSLTSSIYFSTPEGYKELNKFGPPPATVGCEHPEGHAAGQNQLLPIHRKS